MARHYVLPLDPRTGHYLAARCAGDLWQCACDSGHQVSINCALRSDNDNPTLIQARILGNSVEKLAATIIGVHPTIQILHTATNTDEVQSLQRLRTKVTVTLVMAAILSLSFLILAVAWWRTRRR